MVGGRTVRPLAGRQRKRGAFWENGRTPRQAQAARGARLDTESRGGYRQGTGPRPVLRPVFPLRNALPLNRYYSRPDTQTHPRALERDAPSCNLPALPGAMSLGPRSTRGWSTLRAKLGVQRSCVVVSTILCRMKRWRIRAMGAR